MGFCFVLCALGFAFRITQLRKGGRGASIETLFARIQRHPRCACLFKYQLKLRSNKRSLAAATDITILSVLAALPPSQLQDSGKLSLIPIKESKSYQQQHEGEQNKDCNCGNQQDRVEARFFDLNTRRSCGRLKRAIDLVVTHPFIQEIRVAN